MRKIDIPFGRPILDVEEIEAVKKFWRALYWPTGPFVLNLKKPLRNLLERNLLSQLPQELPHFIFLFTHQILVPAMK